MEVTNALTGRKYILSVRPPSEHPYLSLFWSIVTTDLDDIVQDADLTEWVEVPVVLCTFANGDGFQGGQNNKLEHWHEI